MNPKDKHADWLLKPTANELADGLAKMYIEKDVNGLFNKRIQNMLRQFGLAESIIKQQQLEIEALKAGKIRAYDNGVEDGRKPNTHPVNPYQSITNTKIEPTVVSYTHPVKELTDEEILKMAADKFHYSEYKLVIDFVRAILRKTQEK